MVSTQPLTATLPFLASIPTAILSPNAATRSEMNGSLSAARVPITTRATPMASAFSTDARVRMPPPSCTRRPRPTILSTAPRLRGSPSKAPSRSTTCTHSEPAALNPAATATGSSE